MNHTIRSKNLVVSTTSSHALQQRTVYNPPSSRNDEQARKNVLKLYREVLKNIPVIKERYNVPGTSDDMKMRVKLDFLRHKNPIRRDLVDAMVFRGYNELDEMQRYFQTRPHVIKYFAEYEPIFRSVHAKNRLLSDVRLEEEEESKKKALEKMRASGKEGKLQQQFSSQRRTGAGAGVLSAADLTIPAEEGEESAASSLLKRMTGKHKVDQNV